MRDWRFSALALAGAALLTGSGCTAVVTILPEALTPGAVGLEYSEDLSIDAAGSFTWRVAAGNLPPGLQLSSDTGLLEGAPTEPGAFQFSVSAASSQGFVQSTGRRDYTLVVHPQLVLASTFAPARVNTADTAAVPASGGAGIYSFTIIGLPAGLTYDPATGIISGTPINAQNVQLLLTVNDAGPPAQTASRTVTLQIKPPPVRITTDSLTEGQIGQEYSAQLMAQDGLTPRTWQIGPGVGSLPPGLRLNQTTGRITGTPSVAGAFAFNVTVTDADSPATSDTRLLSIMVPAPTGDLSP
jgi:hypothetical protein